MRTYIKVFEPPSVKAPVMSVLYGTDVVSSFKRNLLTLWCKKESYPGEISGICPDFTDNPCSDVWLNLEKSTEVIVPARPGRTEHIIQNGSLDKKVLNEHPFNKAGNVTKLFDQKIDTEKKIIHVIERLNDRL